MITKIKSINPYNKKAIGETNLSTHKEVEDKILLAKKAFLSWCNDTQKNRILLLNNFLKNLKKETRSLSLLIQHEVGKTQKDADIEIFNAFMAMDYYINRIKKVENIINPNKVSYIGTKSFIKLIPHGVVGLITPWNFPLSMPIWTLTPALLTGNTIIFKPSEKSLLIGEKINYIANRVFPKGVFNTIYGDSEIGKFLVKSNINKIFFTGSLVSGQDVIKNADIKPVSLELGGKDSAIVFKDANIDFAVKGITWGAMNNNGEVCSSIEKIYVHKNIANEFIDKITKKIARLKIKVDFGPLVNEEQLNKVDQHVKKSILAGAKILIGGKKIDKEGYFFEPTILTNVKEDMEIMKEETFGPIVTISIVKNEDDAIDLINKSNYGLGVSLWTKDLKNGEKLADNINVGMVWINDVGLPLKGADYWGGTKMSGIRSTEEKIKQCLKAKVFILNKGETREWWF